MKRTIMTVDDSAATRQMVKFSLETAGYAVLECAGGQEAMATLNASPDVDMLIVDLNMPGMDGLALTRNVRRHARFKYIPIVMLTTESAPEKRREAKAAGMTGWIVKPFKPAQLVGVVQKVLR